MMQVEKEKDEKFYARKKREFRWMEIKEMTIGY